MANANPVPRSYATVTPTITLNDTSKAIDFYRNALGATERMRMPGPDGKILHAEIQIGNSIIMLADEGMGCESAVSLGGSPIGFYVYMDDADAVFQKAISAGGKEIMPMTDMFWGDRMGSFEDPFGYRWSIAMHVRDMTPEQMKKGQEEFIKKQMAGAR